MTDRIRRAFRKPERKETTDFVGEMREARQRAVCESRAARQRIHRMEAVLRNGDIDYDELNRAMFGRPGWPREEQS